MNSASAIFDQYFKQVKKNGQYATYTFENYEVRDYSSSRYHSNNRSTLGRLADNIIMALNEHTPLLKLITIVLDDDLIVDFFQPRFCHSNRNGNSMVDVGD